MFEILEHRPLVKRNIKLLFLFLNQNICCGYSKEQSQRDQKNCFNVKTDG